VSGRRCTPAAGACCLVAAFVAFVAFVGCQRGEREKIWSIGIYEGPSPLRLSPAASVTNPVLSAEDVTDVPASFVADPFLVRHDGAWLMFFEVFHSGDRQGDIGLATSEDGLTWSYVGIVLDEPFSVSYPQVFRHEGALYMLPETHEAGVVQLYRADVFPRSWRRDSVLMRGNLVDPTLLVRTDRLWLFAETDPDGNDELRLFGADALRGPWREHPRSPVVRADATRARPAGPLLRYGPSLRRPAQVDAPEYGLGVRAFEILALDSVAYEEREVVIVPPLRGQGEGWAAAGMHHISAIEMEAGRWRAAVDGYRFAGSAEP
jgi:hypothetical protein